MSLRLDGTDIKGYQLQVVAALDLAGDSLSGSGSGTEVAETGDKPKKITVELQYRFVDADQLRALVKLAEARDAGGSRKTYQLGNQTASAMGVRQARFLGELTAREDASADFWSVRFQLQEVNSIPEQVQARETTPATTDVGAAGTATGTEQPAETVADLSTFEKVLTWVDDSIGGSDAG